MFEQRLHVNAEPTSHNFPLRDELIGHALCEVAGNCARQAVTNFVDADDVALEIYERTAGIAAVNGGVMADQSDEPANVFAVELESSPAPKTRNDQLGVADDAECDRLRQCHRAAHRQHVITDANFRRIAEANE